MNLTIFFFLKQIGFFTLSLEALIFNSKTITETVKCPQLWCNLFLLYVVVVSLSQCVYVI